MAATTAITRRVERHIKAIERDQEFRQNWPIPGRAQADTHLRLIRGTPTLEDLRLAAYVLDAYARLIGISPIERERVIRRLRKARLADIDRDSARAPKAELPEALKRNVKGKQ